MARTLRLNDLQDALEDLEYPLTHEDAGGSLGDVTIAYADGEEPLSDVLDRVGEDRFASAEDLATQIYNVLPVEAVGEPGQSEGDA